MYRAAEYLIESGNAYVTSRRPRRCAPTAATLANPAWTALPRPHPSGEPGTLSPDARWCAGRRRGRAARQDRHGQPEHQPARPGHLPHPRASTTTPATNGASTRCTPSRTRSRTRWSASPTASARWSLKTSARSTTGCSIAWPAASLIAQPHPRQYEFARLNLTYVVTSKRKLRQLVDNGITSAAGTTRACPPSPACAGAATRPPRSRRSASASA